MAKEATRPARRTSLAPFERPRRDEGGPCGQLPIGREKAVPHPPDALPGRMVDYRLPDRSVGVPGGPNPLEAMSWQDVRDEAYAGR